MKPSRRSSLLVILLAAALAAGAWWLLRPRDPAIEAGGGNPEAVRVIRSVRAEFDAAPSIRLDAAETSAPEVIESVAAALAVAPDDRIWLSDERREAADALARRVTPEQRAALARTIATWLTLLARGDADAYAAWMRSRGYTPTDTPPEEDFAAETYRLHFGKPMPAGMSRDELFRSIFARSPALKRGVYDPASLGLAEMRFAIADLDKGRITDALMPDKPLDRWWTGRLIQGARPHWSPPVTEQDVFERDGSLLVAAVCAAVRNVRGGWFTLVFYCYFEPRSREWHISQIHIQPLTDDARGVGIEM